MSNNEKIYKNEDVLQADCFQWSWKHRPETRRSIYHVPNGGKRLKSEAARFKAIGVVSGVSDIHIIWAGVLYIIEMKVLDNHITDNQAAFAIKSTEHGAVFYECRSLEKFQLIVDRILASNPLPCEADRLVKIGPDKWAISA